MKTLQYHRKRPESSHLIIYVHGFTGGPKTFKNRQKKYLHEYVDQTIRSQCDFASFGYHSLLFDLRFLRRVARYVPVLSKGISPAANQKINRQAELLSTYYHSLKKQYKTISFICHSLGGILVKQLLVTEFLKGGLVDGFYITLATPHQGVAGASGLKFLGNIHIGELEPFSECIDRLSESWPRVSPAVKAQYFCALDDNIVHVKSSCPRNEDAKLVTVEGDHITISKPEAAECALIRSLNLTISAFLNLDNGSPIQSRDLADYVLFQSYRHELKPYYLLRKIDSLFADALEITHVWISGACGCGKTVLGQHALVESKSMMFYVDVSPCCNTQDAAEYFRVIHESIRTACRSNNCAIPVSDSLQHHSSIVQEVSDLLTHTAERQPVCIFIDEVYVAQGAVFEQFTNLLLSLANHLANRLDVRNSIRLVIAAPSCPKTSLSQSFLEKFNSMFREISVDVWGDEDIRILIDLISTALALNLSPTEKDSVVFSAKGSPRRVKHALRIHLRLRNRGAPNMQEAVAQMNQEEIT